MNIIQQPALLSFDGDTNYLVLRPSQSFGYQTNRGRIDVTFAETFGQDEKVLIEGIEFRSRPQVDDSEVILQLVDDSDPGQVELTARSFVSAFNSNPILNKRFRAEYITSPSIRARIYSLTDGPKGNLTFETFLTTPVFFTDSFPAVVDYESDAYNGYSYRVDIYSSPFNFPFDTDNDRVKTDSISQAVGSRIDNVDINFDLNPYCPAKRYYPTFDGDSCIKLNRFVGEIYATYLNEYNVPVEEYLTNLPHWFTTLGGRSQIDRLTTPIDKYYLLGPTIEPLTTLFDRKIVFRSGFDQRELLSFIYADQLGYGNYNLRIKLKIRFEDGTNLTVYRNPIAVDNTDRNGLNIVDVSPSYLGLPQIEIDNNKAIQWYELTVVASYLTLNTPITRTIKYRVLEDCSLNKYQILFLNSLGGWETFMFTGVNNLGIATSQVRFDRSIGPNDTTLDFNDSIKVNNLTDTISLNSRYLNRDEMSWAKEIVKSPYLYLLADDDSYIPVVMDKAEWSWNGVDELYTLNLDVRYSHQDTAIEG